jgi:hypothetical protein
MTYLSITLIPLSQFHDFLGTPLAVQFRQKVFGVLFEVIAPPFFHFAVPNPPSLLRLGFGNVPHGLTLITAGPST